MLNLCRLSLLSRCGLFLILMLPSVGAGQILDVRDLNTAQIEKLDRQRTVVILQGGILEEHGPFLPIYSDGWMNEYLTKQLADALVARPGWTVLIFPVVPLGSGGANELAGKRSFAGTFAVRPATLRAVYMDLADELGLQGFRWIFLMNAHGAPSHSRALFDACDYFKDTYGRTMVHLWGLAPMGQWFADPQKLWSEEARVENGFLVHADMLETSYLLFLRASAVQAGYTRRRVRTAARRWRRWCVPQSVRAGRVTWEHPGWRRLRRVLRLCGMPLSESSSWLRRFLTVEIRAVFRVGTT